MAIRARPPWSSEGCSGANEQRDDAVLRSDAFDTLELADDSEPALLDLVTSSGLAVSGTGLPLPLLLGAVLGSSHTSGKKINAMARALHLPPLAIV